MVAYGFGTGLIWPHHTDRKNEPFSDYGGATFGFRGRPGDQLLMLDFFQHSDTDDIITIESITPAEPSGPWRVSELGILVRRPGEPLLTAGVFSLGSIEDWRSCEGQAILDPDGYQVQPGESVMLAEVLTLGPGEGDGSLGSPAIEFTRNGTRYRSHPGMDLEIKVVQDARPFGREATWEWACTHPDGTF
jgi:hypothetical protein